MSPPFFRSMEISAADAAAYPDAIRRMRNGAIDGILVREVYSPADCAHLCARLEQDAHGLPRSEFPARMRAFFLGMNLNLAAPDLALYFRCAPAFRRGLQALFAGVEPLDARLCGLLSALDGGRPYGAAPGTSDGTDHMFTTLRAHLPGGFIPPHFDNEQGFRGSYRLVMPHIVSDLFSLVLAFSQADEGGELQIFDLHHGGRDYRMTDGPDDAGRICLDDVDHVDFRLAPGEMIVFNSGRHLHRLTPVRGTRTRWSACSFMAETRSGDRVYCWG